MADRAALHMWNGPISKSLREHFEAWLPKKRPRSKCWMLGLKPQKLGHCVVHHLGRRYSARRIAYILAHGKIPKGLRVGTSCGNAGCMNDRHLKAMSFRSILSLCQSPVGKNARKTHCPKGHRLAGNNLDPNKLRHDGGRSCLTCKRATNRRYYHRQKGNL